MPTKPNILLIHADQHRYDCLGAYGNKDIRTPNIDTIAGDGVIFENSFCPFPVCTPSRYSLLSGQYVHQHRGLDNRCTLSPDIPTLPRLLKSSGYRTTAIGKMHFTPTYLDVGFEEMLLAEQDGNGRYDDDYHRWLRDEGLIDRIDLIDQVHEFRKEAPPDYKTYYGAFTSDLDEKHHSTTWIGERAAECIDAWSDEGNFLMVGFIKPHHPFDPPHPWAKMYDPDKLSLLSGWTAGLTHGDNGRGYFEYNNLSEETLRRVMALYYASISQIDHHVGRMISLLKNKGIYDNTVIIYTSDHGDYMGSHHRILKGHRMFDPLVRVPLIIKYPSSMSLSGKDARLVNNIDLAPTLLSLAGTEIPNTMQGLDLTDPDTASDYVFSETGQEVMVRSANRKLLLRRKPEECMFFDLERDPLELENLIDSEEYRADIALLRSQLQVWPLFFEGISKHLDPDTPQIKQNNVREGDSGLYSYFRSIMDERKGLPLS